MKNTTLFLVLFAGLNLISAQSISSKRWTDLFSYNNVLAMKEDHGRIIAATENGIFFYTPSSGEITKLSKANGLHEVKISAFDYNPDTKIGLVGYRNGSMDVITPEGITYVVDIPIATGFNGDKKINHISISGDRAVISVNYGVSIFNLNTKEFAQSAFFINGGVFTASNEATIKGDKVYSATDNGLKSHDITVTFPVYSTWTTTVSGSFNQIDSESNTAASSANTVYYENGGIFSPIPQTFTNIGDVVVTSQNIVVTDVQKIYTFSITGQLQNTSTINEDCNTAITVGGKVYGGTKLSGIKNTINESFRPDGPYKNESYKISLLNNQIWVSTGSRDSYNDPIYRDLGYYHFDGAKWNYPDYFLNNPITFNILDVVPNPSNPALVYFTNFSFFPNEKGIYKMENNVFKKVYKNSDSNEFSNRPGGISFDEDNNMFVSVSGLENSSASVGYYLYNASADDFSLIKIINAGGVQKPLTKDGFLYIPCPFFGDGGLIIQKYDSNPSNPAAPFKILRTDNNLPANGTVSVAVDQNDDVWIGTRVGLRVISDPSSVVSDSSPQTEAIVIEQNGVAEEVFRDSQILQIEVDSGNHKWVSVDGGGAYMLSPNGEQTLQHFTKENSPIPTNSITDIKVDPKSGKVYFVTLDGIVVYQSDVVGVNSNFGNVLVYPNPVVTANYKGNVTIRGLAMKTNIRITDAAGNLVHQAVARGGFYSWDLNNQKGRRVASGIYFVLMTNEDGTDKATAKIAVVN